MNPAEGSPVPRRTVLKQLALAVTSVLTFTVGLTLTPVTNGVVNLDRALEYAMDNGFVDPGIGLMVWEVF